MTSTSTNAQNPPTVAASKPSAPANSSSSGSSAVAAGQAAPTARSSYANATKSPPIANSAAPIVVGGQQHGRSISPVNGNSIKPAVPAMGPTIANGAASQGDHSRKSSVTISAAGTSGYIPNGGPAPNSRAPSNLTFGSLAGSPAPSHAVPHPQGQNLNPQAQNPRVASPAHSPSPIPTPISSGGKPDNLPTRPGLVFGGNGSGSADSNPISLPTQPSSLPQAQHLRRESSQSAHSDMSNPNMNRGFPPNGGGRGTQRYNNYPPMHPGASPQPFRALPNQPRGPNMAPTFQPQMHPSSPFRANRSPAIAPAAIHQQANYSGYNYPQQPFQQPAMYGPPQALDPYNGYYGQNYPGQNYGMSQGMHYPGVPASPGRGGYPPQPYPVPGYAQPPQAQGMSRTPSNMSERPPSAAQQPSTPAMTNVSHVSQTPSAPSGSPAPGSSFSIPPKTKSKAIVIKTADGQVVDFNTKKPASPAQPPAPSKSPAIVATPTPPPRPESTHSRAESAAGKSASDVKADFIKQFQQQLQGAGQKEDEDKKKAVEAKEAEEKARKEKEEADAAAKAQAEKEAKEKEAAEAAKLQEEEAKRKAEEEKRKQEEEMERMIEEMERAEKEEQERERKYAEEKKRKAEEAKAREAEEAKAADERMKQAEREAEALEAARTAETPEQKAEREKANQEAFASLKKNTQFGPAAYQTETTTEAPAAPAPPAEPTVTPPGQPKSAGATKPKPSHLKLDTHKSVEPPAPTPGMMSLKSARFLQVQSELVKYPEGILSPNPALNVGTKSKGKVYEPSFLLQFQEIFKEKPAVDWDMKLKETVGDSSESAGPKSARGPPSGMGGRQPSRGGLGPMGSFTGSSFPAPGGRTLPPGTTSAQRFEQSQRAGPMTNPLAQLVGPRPGGSFPVQMNRTSSFQNMGQMAPNSPRVGSSRGRGSRRGDKAPNKKEEAAMPLTSGIEIKGLEKSATGWTPHSKVQVAQQPAAGHMPPDMVQRKVKAALNKMTPEKFEKISDQILEIAGQSKNEDDGRTLRQVIQLTFEKACDEQHWSSMYAKFCFKMLNTMDPAIRDETVKDKHGQPVVGGALFRKYLLNRCQEEFEKGWEVNLPAKPEGDNQEAALLSDEYYIAAAAKRKGLGLIQFIGELYKLNMLTLRIMHECVLKLLDFEGLPDESAIESLVKLLRTVGATMSQADAGPKMLQVYFERVEKIMNMEALPSRLKFMLLDLIDLRKSNWHDKAADKGPKTIQQIHAEAAAAQQAAAQQAANSRGGRLPPGRGDARSFSGGGIPPPQDFNSRVAMDDLRKLTKGSSGRNSSGLGPGSMLGGRSGSGRRGLGPGGAFGAGADSGASSRTTTPPVPKEKDNTTHANSFSALMSLGDNEGAEEVGSPPPTATSPPQSKAAPRAAATDAKPAE
ncbi:hypothetical protein BU23DRAFT_225384 [Bimuria novae-zelandiae CBS 107.79]|uniref:MIF4G domain-containing protein n=1 Tax=Bimuria novae-zelandiae CBS 107.79 TaxID=1447943 RepID=A0A6A5VPM1_9PLEO|nr:hypothetical protein BU23DRAFT_225384 [Bimuria novae-zelandiae CBS 107.79]